MAMPYSVTILLRRAERRLSGGGGVSFNCEVLMHLPFCSLLLSLCLSNEFVCRSCRVPTEDLVSEARQDTIREEVPVA